MRACLVIAGLVIALTVQGATATATDRGFATLDVSGETVTIYRDDFGRPHIFAETERGLFEAYGYSVAKDRLWQLELNRRAAYGRLSEIFGAATVNSDIAVRTVGYTDAELDAQFARLTPDEQAIFQAYAAGINRYLTDVVAHDPLALPFEFHALGITPQPWSTRDSIAFGAFMARRFGEIGGRELTNAQLLDALVALHGPVQGYEIFNDVRWINDPDSPVTVPTTGAIGKPQRPELAPAQLRGASQALPVFETSSLTQTWEEHGVPSKLGSYAWVVSAARSAEGAAMLYGGPQMGFSVPEVLHEVQLRGGDAWNVTGMAFAGVPAVLIGRNDHVAWTSTTATGDNVDTYVETLCGGGAGYMYNGACTPFSARAETISVRGGAAVAITVLRSVHGPVVASAPGVVFTQKRAHWGREIDSIEAFIGFDLARNINDFAAAAHKVVTSHNFLYVDQVGNIAYWQTGHVPLRPAGFDTRLPLPGDGSAEWPGGLRAIPTSINPAQGYLANWNNKPSVDYDNADEQIFGKQFRIRDIDDRLRVGTISLADMRDIPKDIARVKGIGRESRFLLPYLLHALAAVPPENPLAPAGTHVLETWDGSTIADAITSTSALSGEVIFSTWLSRMIPTTFGDELGAKVGESGANMLIHVLDDALGGGSGVPPSRDYFNGADPNAVMSAIFDATLATLAATQGLDPSAWTAPRGVTTFRHPIVGTVATIPQSNRATYAQIVVARRPHMTAENIFTLGQSGFIRLVPPSGFAFDPHFMDQLGLYGAFGYKPMPLYLNTKLNE